MIGKILGNRYEILQKIGTGGMGDVYKAHCRRLDRIVAIKTLKSEYNSDNNFIRKFKRESLATASISHPNIVSIYDVGTEEIDGEKVHYIVMEYIDGITLKEKIQEEGKLSEKIALNYTVQIAEALKVAHSKGIVHRDIKSQNIMITKDDRIKVTDFGIARIADNATVTATNAIMGSVHYFSPEQARGTKVDNRSDIYSLGIVLYEMLTGELPFDAENPVSVALMQVQSNMPLPSSKNPQVSQYADQIVSKMTMKDPQDRYSDVYLLIRDIKNIQLGRTGTVNYRTQTGSTGPISKTAVKSSPILERKNLKKEEPRYIKNKVEKKNSSLPIFLGVLTAILLAFMLLYIVPKMVLTDKPEDTQVEEVTTVKVPPLIGLSQDQAREELEKAGLTMDADFADNYEKANREVLEQSPEAGTEVEQGSAVKVKINVLKDVIEVPNLVGKTLEEAQALVAEAGLTINNIELEYSDEYEENLVIKQEPASGSEVVNDKNLTVYVSKGKEDLSQNIPNLRGVNQEEAKATLEKLGFVVKIEEIKYTGLDVGDVVDYEPKDVADKGTEITLYVTTGPEEKPEENNTGNENSGVPESSEENSYGLPETLTVNMPDDNARHNVVILRRTAGGDEYKIYDYNKESSEGDITVTLQYVSKGDVFEVYIDGEKVETKKIN
ncbi:putative serine/threonine protein kinase [Peptoniphilus sp. ING2-D1G]|nr:putative serine/threonine protein kinase [Peptoniphilus sp. ING2-D1G]